MKILLIEDDTTIAAAIKEGLEDEAYAVDVAHDGDEGYRTAHADDYLPKPFHFEVLLARVRALLRRPHTKQREILTVGDLTLDPATKKVARATAAIHLTAKEYAVLEYLMRNAGVVRSKDTIISHVWDFDADVLPNNVELFIMFLRRKIDKPFGRPLIHTVPGFGYVIEDRGNAETE